MTQDELEIKKFELEQKVKLEELELKKKELDLRIQEQKGKRISTPLNLSIIGGLITLITGIVLNHFDNSSKVHLEDKKFQSSLLLKATDADTYEEFSDMLVALQENGLLSLDSAKVANFRKNRFVAETTKALETDTTLIAAVSPDRNEKVIWSIIAGGDIDLEAATYEKNKAEKNGFKDVRIWLRNGSYRTCIGKYDSNTAALDDLFDTKEKLNKTAYVVRLDQWCPNKGFDEAQGIVTCD